MEELVLKARKRAEDFLLKEVAKISSGIKKEEEKILHPPFDDTITCTATNELTRTLTLMSQLLHF